MLPRDKFDAFDIGEDVWNKTFPVLKLDDLPARDEYLPIQLSFLIGFTNNRRTQLARSLECLARQTWRNFEVLICDDGSTQDMESVYKLFRPYLRMTTVRLERQGFSGDPSRAIKALVPLAKGEVFATMQPEMMLVHNAASYLYQIHFGLLPPSYSDVVWMYYVDMSRHPDVVDFDRPKDENSPRFACLKTGFLNAKDQRLLDTIDWHSDTRAIENIPEFWTHGGGLADMSNAKAMSYNHWPWWFVCSMKATDSVWRDMPEMRGHAGIDFFLLNYRMLKGYIDICPKPMMAYHQCHDHNGSISPEGEQASLSIEELRKKYVDK